VRAGTRHSSLAFARSRIDRFDQAGLADRDVNEAGCGIEERHIRSAGNRPHVRDPAGAGVDLDQRAVVAGGVKAPARMIDVEAVRTI
jgi:hypothetical protein